MATLTIHPASGEQEKVIRAFLDALHVDYKTTEEINDITNLLTFPEKNAEHVQKPAEQEKKGRVTKPSLNDVWKL
jgi:hypothetical protein